MEKKEEQQKEKEKHNFKWFLTWLIGTGGTAMTVFTWEMLEEVLENVIALGISSAIAGVALVFFTQAIKIGFKKLIKILFPFIKRIFYKKGNDKIKFIKNHFKKENKTVKTTKLSGIQIASIVGAVLGIAFAVVSVFVPQIAIAGDSIYNILIATGVEGLCAFAGTFKGYKTLTDEQIAKIQDKKKAKENKALQVKAEKAQKELDRIEGLKAIVAEAEIAKNQEINK